MDDLIERLTTAEVGGRELDAEIAVAIFVPPKNKHDLIYAKLPLKADNCAPGTWWRKSRSGASLHTSPRYTTSINSALTLVPIRFAFVVAQDNTGRGYVYIAQALSEPQIPHIVEWEKAATPALAICAAALKARKET